MDTLQFVEIPLGCITAIGLIAMLSWTVSTATRDAIAIGKRLHKIPCAECRFFTGDYRLKCTIHPKKALTEEAIYCCDYHPYNNSSC